MCFCTVFCQTCGYTFCDYFREVYVTIADTTEHACIANNSDKPVASALDEHDDDDESHDEINEVLATIDQVI